MIIRILAKFNFILFHKIRQHRQNNSYNIYYTIMESIIEKLNIFVKVIDTATDAVVIIADVYINAEREREREFIR